MFYGCEKLVRVQIFRSTHMGVSTNGGYPKIDGLSWEKQNKMDDLRVPYFRKPPSFLIGFEMPSARSKGCTEVKNHLALRKASVDLGYCHGIV